MTLNSLTCYYALEIERKAVVVVSVPTLERVDTMSISSEIDYNSSVGGDVMPIFTVIIHRNEDGCGYWAVCDMPNGGATTMGDTIHETQRNMYESMALFLEDDYPNVTDFSLNFVISQ